MILKKNPLKKFCDFSENGDYLFTVYSLNSAKRHL